MSSIGRALQRRLVSDWLRVLPDVAILSFRIVRDSRVPAPIRGAVAALGAYLVFPIDVVPDWIPFAGRIDDAVVFAFGMRALLRRVDEDILLDHWRGSTDSLSRLLGRDLGPSGGRVIDVEPVED